MVKHKVGEIKHLVGFKDKAAYRTERFIKAAGLYVCLCPYIFDNFGRPQDGQKTPWPRDTLSKAVFVVGRTPKIHSDICPPLP